MLQTDLIKLLQVRAQNIVLSVVIKKTTLTKTLLGSYLESDLTTDNHNFRNNVRIFRQRARFTN